MAQDRDEGRRERDEQERGRDRDQERSFQPMDWTTSNSDYREGSSRDFGGDPGRGTGREDYRPTAGDYGRGSEWERDPYRRTSFAGSAARSNHQDPPYDEIRRRHMDELDRDYQDYCRERGERFEKEFGAWREQRQSKRQLLGQAREHMKVVGSDGEPVGTVDRIAGDRIILTRSDPEAQGAHHSISCTMVERIEEDRVVLDVEADEARDRWRDEERQRALFEREDQGGAGPHILDRSFSGTYR